MLKVLQQPSRLFASHSRLYSTQSAQHPIYISNSTNAYFNLTFEDWLFRHKAPQEPLLLIYRDDPCVVVGRNQNPWKEVNFKALRERPGIPFIRRRSGGGTVYHDLGNTNFSIHLPREKFDRHITAQIVLRAVQSLGIDACVNDRNDICVGEDKMRSAYKIVNKRAYHHGTMLISTQLDTLGDLLRTNKVGSPTISHESFTDAVVEQFRKEYSISTPAQVVNETDDLKAIDYIQKGMKELPSWDWAYGQTPEFTYTIQRAFNWGSIAAEIRSKHGIINQCTFQITDSRLNEVDAQALMKLGQLLEGQRYGFLDGLSDVREETGPSRDVLTWINGIVYI
ncbi:hypothetical protein C0991_006536 [Blastosporella zonata]|nr:hypothetical protein C0991_006536 [Blastosporella zonata]